MTREFRLMLAEQGAADPELMGATVSAEIKSPEALQAMAMAAVSPAEAMREACRNIASKWQSIAVQRSCGVAVGLCADSIIRDINEIPLPADPRDVEIERVVAENGRLKDALETLTDIAEWMLSTCTRLRGETMEDDDFYGHEIAAEEELAIATKRARAALTQSGEVG